MASENLELVRSICTDWEQGDFSSSEWAHPELEYVYPDGPAPGSWTGVVAALEAWNEFLNAWEDYGIKVDEYRELDAQRVLVLFHRSGRGKMSGLELGQVRTKGASVVHVRGGKVTRLVAYFDRERALADLGLAPEAEAR